MGEWASHSDLAEAEARLNLRIIETERYLRNEFSVALQGVKSDLGQQIAAVDDHLTQQDGYFLARAERERRDAVDWQKWLMRLVVAVALGLVLHFALGVG